MKEPAAILITFVNDVCIAVPLTKKKRKRWLAGKNVIDKQTMCEAFSVQNGYEISNIFVDLKAGGNVAVSTMKRT